MDIHYNAFISYRHHPDDIRVAMEIHRGLERFKIPRAIRKNSGPMHLFRDKEELPITSHLTDDIGRALENSDFLIVICSPHTKESVWVQREIETFLKTHSRDRVLTVLAAGEPYDVIPEILLHEDVLNPVTGQIHRQEIEPLSCDWRMKKRKAVREELPRLAAPLLGCAYDELRQRQRQYRMRRTVAAFSAALVASLGLTAYFIHTSIQIQKANDDLHAANVVIQEANVQIRNNLDQALRNQSQYLASSSTERMEAGDRMTALALALEALPSENNPRPYVAEAEYALSNALSSYQQEEEVSALGSFEVGGLVQQYLVSDDGMTIYILDARGIITVWDTQTFQQLSTIDASDNDLRNMYLTGGGNLIFTTGNLDGDTVCYAPDGSLLWKKPFCRDIAFLDNRQTLMLIQYDYDQNNRILFADPETGEETAQPLELSALPEGLLPSGFFQEDYAAGLPITLDFFNGLFHYVYIARPQTGELSQVLEVDTSFAGGGHSIDCVAVDQNGSILVMRGDGSGISNGTYQTFEVTSADSADILCFDGQTLQQKWQSKITTYIYTGASTIAAVPDSQWLLCQSGNTFQLYDSLTGECLMECQTPAIPLDMTVDVADTWGILENGSYFSLKYADFSCYAMSFMEDTIDMAIAKRGYFVHSPLGRQVTVYRSVKDDAGTVLTGEYSYSIDARLTYGRHLMVRQFDKLRMLDMQEQKLLWEKELDYTWDVLGFSRDGSQFWMWNRYDNYARAFRTQTGDSLDVAVYMGDLYLYPESDMFLVRDKLLYLLESDGKMELRRVDLNSGSEELPLEIPGLAPEKMDFTQTTQFLAADDSHAWIWKDEETLYVIDLHTGDLKELRTGMTTKPRLTVSQEQSSLLLVSGNELLHADMDGTVVNRISLGKNKGVGACFYKSEYLVLCDDGEVYRYDRQGNQLSQTSLHLYNTFSGNVNYPDEDPMSLYWWITDDGDVVLNAFGAGNIIDCDQWQVRAFVPNLFVCSENACTLICHSSQKLYAYSRYTTAEQMEKAHQTLGDFQLSEEDRKAYGLG